MQPDAPRLKAMLSRYEGRSVIAMPRSDWSAFGASSSESVAIRLEATPLAGLTRDASVLAAVARRFSDATGEVVVYRDDPKDYPNPVNEDRYEVWLDLPSHGSYKDMVRAASTEDNANMRSYLSQTVFLVKLAPGPEHWLPEVPGTVRVLMRST